MSYQPSRAQLDEMRRMVGYNAGVVRRRAPDVPRDDLVAEGYYALTLALRRYDPTASTATLWTFAEPRVRGAMLDLVRARRAPGERGYEFVEAGEDLEAPQAAPDGAMDLAALLATLQDPTEREVIRLFLDGHSKSDIARRLNVGRKRLEGIYTAAIARMRAEHGAGTDISRA